MYIPNLFQNGSSIFCQCRKWEAVLSEFCWLKIIWNFNKEIYSCCLLSANNKQISNTEETGDYWIFPQRMHPISCLLSLFLSLPPSLSLSPSSNENNKVKIIIKLKVYAVFFIYQALFKSSTTINSFNLLNNHMN